MEQSAMTIRMDRQLKYQFEDLCNQFGMSINTAINIFVRAVIDTRSIPFAIEDRQTRTCREAFEAFNSIRQDVKSRNMPELTLDEINAEIAATRKEMHRRKQSAL